MSIRFTRDENGKKKLKKKIQKKCHGKKLTWKTYPKNKDLEYYICKTCGRHYRVRPKNKEALERLLSDLEKIKEKQDRLHLLADLDRFGDELLSEEAISDPEKLLRQSEI